MNESISILSNAGIPGELIKTYIFSLLKGEKFKSPVPMRIFQLEIRMHSSNSQNKMSITAYFTIPFYSVGAET